MGNKPEWYSHCSSRYSPCLFVHFFPQQNTHHLSETTNKCITCKYGLIRYSFCCKVSVLFFFWIFLTAACVSIFSLVHLLLFFTWSVGDRRMFTNEQSLTGTKEHWISYMNAHRMERNLLQITKWTAIHGLRIPFLYCHYIHLRWVQLIDTPIGND